MKYSFIVQYFNHRDNIISITNSIINIPDCEVIFHNDSNSDHDIFNELQKKHSNFKVICSNDIHEIRGYNKCIPECKGEYIFICQDDDIMSSISYIKNVEYLFNKFKFLGIIGLLNGGINNWGIEKYKLLSLKNSKLEYFYNNLNVQFVSWANIGPLIIKKTVFNKIGLFDLDYSEIGELGIGYDSEYTFRANLNGIRVMLLEFNDIKRGVGGHGTKGSLKKKNQRKNRARKNRELYNNKYQYLVDNVDEQVISLNNTYLNKK